MLSALVTISLAFLEGFLLILSPCILPILPILLAGSLAGSKKRPLGIILGFSLSFALFAFFSKALVDAVGTHINLIRYLAYTVLFFLGLTLFFEGLMDKFKRLTQTFAYIATHSFFLKRTGEETLLSGFILGSLLALIWTPCAGPILAAVLVQTILQQTTFVSFLTLFAFAFGASIPMGLIAFYGKKCTEKYSFFKMKSAFFMRILGLIIMISVGVSVYQEYYFSSSNRPLESSIRTATYLKKGLWSPYKAPALARTATWLNSTPLKLENLKGKVVLIDFWTYSCINCIRTLPYLKTWYAQYKDLGFVLIGVHSPEFAFEKDLDNVKRAVAGFGIKYPVLLDNQFRTWLNYNNHYWPAHYLLNKEGYVVYTHFGEGNYDITENNIRYLLGLHDNLSTSNKKEVPITSKQTGETYLGYARADGFLAPKITQDKNTRYHFPAKLEPNAWAMEGLWLVQADKIVSMEAKASLTLSFHARKVFIVMDSQDKKPLQVQILFNNKPIKTLTIDKAALYEALALPSFESGIIQVITDSPGLAVYTFTFES